MTCNFVFVPTQEPFITYPGEVLVGAEEFGKSSMDFSKAIKLLPIIAPNHAVELMARVDHLADGEERKCGDKWQVEGPITYLPTAEAVRYLRNRPLFSNSIQVL